MGAGRPDASISGSLDLEAEGAGMGGRGADYDAQTVLAADGVVEAPLRVQAVAGPAEQPAGTTTKGQFVAVPAQAAWAQADQSVERRTQGLDGCALPPGRNAPGERVARPPLPGRKGVFLDRAKGRWARFERR